MPARMEPPQQGFKVNEKYEGREGVTLDGAAADRDGVSEDS